MAPDPSAFEKLGSFYLGRDIPDGELVLLDSRDLVTHAVCVGMTGSGKTGLCLALLEEAAMDGVPAIIIDPKGDLANLLLTFPDLRPEDFRPWINEDDARRKGVEPEAWAASQAETWKNGLATWGQDGARIRALREKSDFRIYTPGSTAGVPVNLLDAFRAPDGQDPETLTEQAQNAVAGLLALLGSAADPVKSREAVFLSALLLDLWKTGGACDLPALIAGIQKPPFEKIGVMDTESFYPAKDRFELVLALNALLASPAFARWQVGEAMDVAGFLRAPDGRPRHAIFSIAHLDDSQRMFFVTLLLGQIVAWMRRQSGTTSLRALVYMDEIFGYFPPVANPPSKLPLLTLLKQARAFGLGVVLSTQNPVDLDYKGLANAGTWFIGRLQTDRDKARVAEGLQSASVPLDRARIDALLAGLGSRKFLLSSIHAPEPVVFESRWVMSYLRGPLTRDQIKTLTPREAVPEPATAEMNPTSDRPPALPPGVKQVFLPSSAPLVPRLLGAATVRFSDAKSGLDTTQRVVLAAEFATGAAVVDWAAAEPLDQAPSAFATSPPAGAAFEPPPSAAADVKSYAVWEKQFARWLADEFRHDMFRCPALKLASRAGESETDFRSRVALAAREERDAKVEALRKKYAPKVAALEARLQRATLAVEKQKQQARDATFQTAISVGTSILGAFLGRKAFSATTISRAGTALKGASRAAREGADVGAAQETVEGVKAAREQLDADFAAESAALAAELAEPPIETVSVKPSRGGVTVEFFGLGWI